MADANGTEDVVQALLQRIGSDPAEIAELYAEQVAWELAWPKDEYEGAVPWIRHRSTRADVEDHYRTVAEFTVPGKSTAEITAIHFDGPNAVVVGALGQTVRSTGASYQVEFILYLTVVDGLIARHHIVEDNLTIRRAFETAG